MAAELIISKLDLRAPVIDIPRSGESWDVDILNDRVGRLEGTAAFESSGNIVLTGYVVNADGKPGIFERLDRLQAGDEIVVEAGASPQRYTVSGCRRVPYDDMSVVAASGERRLTLLTCALDSYDPVLGDYRERHVVSAAPVKDKTDTQDAEPIRPPAENIDWMDAMRRVTGADEGDSISESALAETW